MCHSPPGSRFGPRSGEAAHTYFAASSSETTVRRRWKLWSSEVPRRARPRSATSAPRSASSLASVEASSSFSASEGLSLSWYPVARIAHRAD
jgi:hypothetical protein